MYNQINTIHFYLHLVYLCGHHFKALTNVRDEENVAQAAYEVSLQLESIHYLEVVALALDGL